MRLTAKDKSKPHSKQYPFMVGFPTISQDRNMEIILNHDYTIVHIKQRGEGENVERYVHEILSTATNLNSTVTTPGRTNQIVSIYIDVHKVHPRYEEYGITCGVACIDFATGKNTVGEMYSSSADHMTALNEIFRFLSAQRPREVLINVAIPPLPLVPPRVGDDAVGHRGEEGYAEFLSKALDSDSYPIVNIQFNKINKEYSKLAYQEEFLRKIFTSAGDHPLHPPALVSTEGPNILEKLNLERMPYGIISYIELLQYCHNHNENLIKSLSYPVTDWIDSNSHLILTHNASIQLDILPSLSPAKRNDRKSRRGKMIDSLLSVVDYTCTGLGGRFLRNILANPITDEKQLDKYYTIIEEILGEDGFLGALQTELRKFLDIEKYHRKLTMGVIKPKELSDLIGSYYQFINLSWVIDKGKCSQLKTLLLSGKIAENFLSCMNYIQTTLDIDNLPRCILGDGRIEGTSSFLKKGVDASIDTYYQAIQSITQELQRICDHLNGFLSPTQRKTKSVELSYSSKDEGKNELFVSIWTTPAKVKTLRQYLSQVDSVLCGKDIQFQELRKQYTRITSSKIEELSSQLETITTQIQIYMYAKYQEVIEKINSFGSYLIPLTACVATIDYLVSGAQCARCNKYYKPTIMRGPSEGFPPSPEGDGGVRGSISSYRGFTSSHH